MKREIPYLFILFIIIIIFPLRNTFSQITFQKTFGGVEDDAANCVSHTSDNLFIISGYTESFGSGGKDILIIKIDQCGDIVWQKAYGGVQDEEAVHIKLTSDNGFILTGITKSFGQGGNDIFLLKIDQEGNTLWAKSFGGTTNERGRKILETKNGYYVVGDTKSFGQGLSDIYIIKVDLSGNFLWSKVYGGYNNDGAHSVLKSIDGNIVITGSTYSYGNAHQIFIMKIDPSGDLIWFKTYGGSSTDGASDIIQLNDASFITTGNASGGAGNLDFFLLKTDHNGNLNWFKTYGGNNEDWGYSVLLTIDNGFVISGYTDSFGFGSRDVYLVKTDSNGNLEWSQTYGGINFDGGQIHEAHQTILITDLDNYLICDYTTSSGVGEGDSFVIKTDAQGIVENCNQYTPNTIVSSPFIYSESQFPIIITENINVNANFSSYDIDLIETIICGISVNLGSDTSICFGDNLILNAGSGFITYLWNTGLSDSLITVSASGLYWVEVTDEYGCTASDSIYIDLFPSPEIDLGNDTLICDGDSLILNAGSGYLSYSWNTGSNDSTIVVDSTGLYWVEVENEFGCSAIDSIMVDIYPFAWEELDLGQDTVFCFGEIIVLNAGSGYTFYQWQDGSSDSIFIADTAGVYYVYVENPCGSGSDTIVLDTYPVTDIDLGNDTAVCSGESVLLDPGFGFLSYLWQNGASNQFFYANQTGAYWVQVIDSNFCYAYDTINLEFILPNPDIGNDTAICSGDSVTFYADDGFVNYLWQDGSVLLFFTADSTGLVWCEVIDTLGCVGRDSIFLDIIYPPVVSLGNDTSFCFGDSLWLNVLPYDNNYDLTWQDGSEDSIFLVTEQGNFWVLASNQCGIDSDSVFVNVQQLPWVFLGNDTILAMNDYLILDAGEGMENYFWNDGSSYQTLTVNDAGNYWVSVFDGLCYNTDSINIKPVQCDMLIPIVITPNWDGDNDYFFADTSEDIYNFSLVVFSRWGEKIWETEVKDDKWDGTKNGRPAADGTYYWITKYKCIGSPEEFVRRGSVTLLR